VKLLFLTPQLPHPPRQGTALRNWGLISHLAARGHIITLLSFDEDGAEPTPELRAACARIVRVAVPRRSVSARLRTMATSALPDMAWRLWAPAFRDALHQLVREEQPDILQIEGIELARYALEPGGASLPRVIFDDHNCEYLFQWRAFDTDVRRPRRWHAAAYSFVQWQRLRDFERRAIQRANAVLAVSEQDQALLRGLAPDADVQVIYNGIDVDTYMSAECRVLSAEENVAAQHSLVFTGKMDFRPNIDAALWFGQQVLPLIAAAVPDVTLSIAGQKPGSRLEALGGDSRITITGSVDDIKPHIAAAAVYVAPLLAGGGTRFKLLEAMAMRKAIVSTTLGAEGFAVTSGREMVLADTPQAFARAVIDLLNNAGLRTAMGAQAHAFVSATYDWRAIVPKLESIYARDH
jgi:polysaccharide biosynthesis protein PslH